MALGSTGTCEARVEPVDSQLASTLLTEIRGIHGLEGSMLTQVELRYSRAVFKPWRLP
jgi:hypothetical protein